MNKRIFITTVMFSISANVAFCQNIGLGNVYQSYQNIPKTSKEQKALRKQIELDAKQNNKTLDENLEKLRSLGYFQNIFVQSVTNNNAKYLIAIDAKLFSQQAELNSKILALKNSEWLDSLNKPIQRGRFYGVDEEKDYNSIQILSNFRNRYSKLVEKYRLYSGPLSTETNDKHLEEISNFWKENDEANLLTLQQGLAKRKQLHEQSLKVLAENNRKIQEAKNKEDVERLAEQNRIRLENEKAQEFQKKRETEIAALPSKAAIRTKFRTYKHKTGHVFEMFPVGFTPRPNKPVYDRAFGRKARYREVDENGFDAFVIEFYDSGNILSVTVYKGSTGIYTANYRDNAKKPYEIRSTSADWKFYLIHKRTYDMYEDKIKESTQYQYVPLDYWYE